MLADVSVYTPKNIHLYSITSLSRTPFSRILDNPDKFWPPENQTQVIFTPVSRNLLKPDKKWPPEVSALTREYCTIYLGPVIIEFR